MTDSDLRPGRVLAARGLAWLLAIIAAVPMFGLIDLGTLFGMSDPRYEWAMSLEASWGALFTFFVAAGFAWVGTLPGKPWPGLVLVFLAAGGLALAGVALADAGPLWVALALGSAAGGLLLLLRPGRSGTVPNAPAGVGGAKGTVPEQPKQHAGGGAEGTVPEQPPGRFRRPALEPGLIAPVLGVPLWLAYAWLSYGPAVAGVPGDVTNGIDHWPVQVALGLALAAGCVLLAYWGERLTLWRWAFAASAGFVAYATLVFPERAGAMPHPAWGVAIAGWGVLAAVLQPRRLSRAQPGPRE